MTPEDIAELCDCRAACVELLGHADRCAVTRVAAIIARETAELRKDAERLDCLQSWADAEWAATGGEIGPVFWCEHGHNGTRIPFQLYCHYGAPDADSQRSIRAAIDAARAASGSESG